MDYAHEQTDIALDALERAIQRVYSQVGKNLTDTMNAYMKRFEAQDAAKLKQVESGQITKEEYRRWRALNIPKGQQYQEAIENAARIANNANKVAMEVINGKLPDLYTLNRNFVNYTFEQAGFSLGYVDKNTIIRLLRDEPDLFPQYKLIDAKDIAYNVQKVRESVTSGLLQGKSLRKIAKDLENVANMNKNSAILHAQTAVTGAENAGRQAGFKQAADMGIKFKREWIATLDSHTRDAHRHMDGQLRDLDEPFTSDLGDIMYPGDTKANPANVWRCRCTLGSRILGAGNDAKRRARNQDWKNDVISDMTYREWEASKIGSKD